MCWAAPGPSKTVEFDFDLGADTAMSVASEMVEDLSLSHEDAQARGVALSRTCSFSSGLRQRPGSWARR